MTCVARQVAYHFQIIHHNMNNYQFHANYIEAQRRYQAQIAWMLAELTEWAEKNGGVENLDGAQKKQYKGRENGLIVLSNFDDAASVCIADFQQLIEELEHENRLLRNQLREATGESPKTHITRRDWVQGIIFANPSRSPQPLAAFCNAKSGVRNASINYAFQSQPNIF